MSGGGSGSEFVLHREQKTGGSTSIWRDGNNEVLFEGVRAVVLLSYYCLDLMASVSSIRSRSADSMS